MKNAGLMTLETVVFACCNAGIVGATAMIAKKVDLMEICTVCFAIQCIVFLLHTGPLKSEKLYDLTGGMTFALCTLQSLMMSPVITARQLILSAMVICWSLRLGLFLFGRILDRGYDWRFDLLKRNRGLFFTTWTAQGFWVFAAGLPVYIVNKFGGDHSKLHLMDYLGFSLWSIGFIIEVVADRQHSVWKKQHKDQFIQSGLWNYSRHPNYFGDILLWIGIACSAAMVYNDWQWLGAMSPFVETMMLVMIAGLPFIEPNAERKWGNDPEYQRYKQEVNLLILGPRRKASL